MREAHRHRNERITALHRVITRALSELLDVVGTVDTEGSFFCDGSAGTADWLAGTLKLTRTTARTWTRLARRLDDYPDLRSAMAAGRLGIEQVAALMKYVDPEQVDGDFIAESARIPAEELEQAARSLRPVPVAQAREDRFQRWHRGRFSDDDRFYLYSGKLPAAEGAILDTAVNRLALQAPRHETCGLFRHSDELGADAIVQIASESLERDGNADRSTVVVHIDAATLAVDAADGTASIEFGPSIPAAAARRMACDGRIQIVAHAIDGSTIGVGRTTRRIPHWLERLVRRRDNGCRFPACGRTRWTNSHHIEFWTRDEGPTDLDNLVTLCGYHHRRLHDEGWTVTGDPAGPLTWRTNHGELYQPPDDPFGGLDGVERRLESMTVQHRLAGLGANAPP